MYAFIATCSLFLSLLNDTAVIADRNIGNAIIAKNGTPSTNGTITDAIIRQNLSTTVSKDAVKNVIIYILSVSILLITLQISDDLT